jgi:hypothetical protein
MTVAVWLALVSPAVAILIALFGFRRSRRADQLAAFFQLQERYLAPEVRDGRRLIHQRVSGRPVEDIANIPDDIRTAVGYSLAVMNAIAIACEARYVDRVAVIRSMGQSYSSAVVAAKPYIDYVEKGRGFRPYGYAEGLAAAIGDSAVTRSEIDPGGLDHTIGG